MPKWTITGFGNEILHSKHGYYVSFSGPTTKKKIKNSVLRRLHIALHDIGWGVPSEGETALVNGEAYIILNGDYRELAESLIYEPFGVICQRWRKEQAKQGIKSQWSD